MVRVACGLCVCTTGTHHSHSARDAIALAQGTCSALGTLTVEILSRPIVRYGQTQLFTGWGAKPITIRAKTGVLVATALAPFGVSLIPPLYVVLVYYYAYTYPLSALYGFAWSALFSIMYIRTQASHRGRLRWLALLVIFAFIEPAHLILLALGVPPFLPRNFSPS